MSTIKRASTRYRTTRPNIPLTVERKSVEARIDDHLIIQLRIFQQTDLEHAHRLRAQVAVMANTSTGVTDATLEVTQNWMNRFLAPNDKVTFNFMIWAKQDNAPWEHVGVIGSHMLTPVPRIGYMLRTEWWGKSITTRAVQTFLSLWWTLERKVVEIDLNDAQDEHDLHLIRLEYDQDEQLVSTYTSQCRDVKTVPEILVAEIEERNIASIRVVQRSEFQYRAQETIFENTKTFIQHDYTIARP
ncbi:hypothetical protein LTR05_002976 [Lithohypha guttulata]|uniref:N-acetyltransferase domain-containing protein n=1 Tax=Lithohypha guttulata TaxID=1690604 RepID=A0AAN7YCS1_9EURO|nr:hypothetical protein LTR05_002976 [Lithohypha guttulata]